MPTETARRRFTLGDVMILVAAAAVGMVMVRFYLAYRQTPPVVNVGSRLWQWGQWFGPFLFAGSWAVLAWRARRPRPPARRILRQPGTLGCLAIVSHVLLNGVLLSIRSFMYSRFGPFPIGLSIEFYYLNILYSGVSVAYAWAVLALARAWRPEPGWIDRSGRALGVVAIIVWLAESAGL